LIARIRRPVDGGRDGQAPQNKAVTSEVLLIVPDSLRLAAARLAADYIWRAEAWAADVDQQLVADLDRLHRRLQEHIECMLGQAESEEGRLSD
jgi:hypothetical protein